MSRNSLLLRCFIGAVACLSILVSGLSRGGNFKNTDRRRDGRPVLDLTCCAHLSALKAGIRVGDTPSKGLGAFALSPIVSGSFVGEYKGEILTLSQVQARYWMTRKKQTADRRWTKSRKQRNQGISGDYLFDMSNDLFIDGEDGDKSSWCRFMNHAIGDTPACNVETRHTGRLEILQENGETLYQDPKLWFVAIRDIESGEELSYDYGDCYWEDKQTTSTET